MVVHDFTYVLDFERSGAIYWQLGIRIIDYRHRKRTILISIHVGVLTAFYINTHQGHGDFIYCTPYYQSSHTLPIQKVGPCYFPPSRETCCKNGKLALQNYVSTYSQKTGMFRCTPHPKRPIDRVQLHSVDMLEWKHKHQPNASRYLISV